MAYNLICTGNITSNGGSNITSEGFYYGLTTSVEIGYIPSTTLVQSGNFTGTITGLLEGTTYYIKSFAINSVGTSITTDYIQQKTLGTAIKAVVTYLTPDESLYYEIGNTIPLNISGTITPNDETKFNYLKLNLNGTKIYEINIGFPTTYSYTKNDFVPVETDDTLVVESNFGQYPAYSLSKIYTLVSVYPYLWAIDNSSTHTSTHYSPTNIGKEYNGDRGIGGDYDGSGTGISYYFDAYNQQGIYVYTSGSLITLQVQITNTNGNLNKQYIHIGFPKSYGNCTDIKIDGSSTIFYLENKYVDGGMTTGWTKQYNIYNIDFHLYTVRSAVVKIDLIF